MKRMTMIKNEFKIFIRRIQKETSSNEIDFCSDSHSSKETR